MERYVFETIGSVDITAARQEMLWTALDKFLADPYVDFRDGVEAEKLLEDLKGML